METHFSKVPRAALGLPPRPRQPESSPQSVRLLENHIAQHGESHPGQGSLLETKLSGCGPRTASFSLAGVPCLWTPPGVAERATAYILVLAQPPAVWGILDQSC